MQREIPRLHSVLACKSKRIGELENVLREVKETFSKEHDRLRQENEKMRQSFMAKMKEKERECELGEWEGAASLWLGCLAGPPLA